VKERPSYRPWLWGTRWPLATRWVKDRPDRVIAWYGGQLVVAVGLLAIALVASSTSWTVAFGLGLALCMLEASVHVPRALRALRDSPRSN
jgi:hypothetical protein